MTKLSNGIIVVLLFHLSGLNCLAQDKIEITGVVLDSVTKEPLPAASISHEKSYMGVATNSDGEFRFYLPMSFARDSIKVSYVGYRSKFLEVNEAGLKQQKIFLQPLDISLGEVVVKTKRITGKDIITKAINRIKNNYYQDNFSLKGFYRELTYENNREIDISEASVEVYKTGYNNYNDAEQVKVIKARKVEPENNAVNSRFKFMGGTYYRNSDDLIKNRKWASFILKEYLPYYKYKIVRVLGSGRETIIVLSFEPNNNYINFRGASRTMPESDFDTSSLMYSGEIFINKADYGIIKIEYWLGHDRLRNGDGVYITKVPRRTSAKLHNVKFSAEYRKINGKYSLSYTSGYLNFTINGPFIEKTDYKVANEFLVLDMSVDNVRRFRPSEITDSADAIAKIGKKYDPDFWTNLNIIVATKRLKRIGYANLKEQ